MSERFATQQPFAIAELRNASGFSADSFENYRSKQFGTLLVPTFDGKVRVSHAFRRFNTWQKFRDEVVSQKRRLIRHYRPLGYQRVMSFEFFMPLRNEEWLREALDSLFFKEQLLLRLRAITRSELEGMFPKQKLEGEDQYLDRVCNWISRNFEGYSISHVSGRLKVGDAGRRSCGRDREVSGG